MSTLISTLTEREDPESTGGFLPEEAKAEGCSRPGPSDRKSVV